MAQYRTAQGKMLDMNMFASQHERVRAVGNMKVNGRGDKIDSQGRVVQSVNDKINEYYNSSVTNPGATNVFADNSHTITRSPQPARTAPRASAAPMREELSAEELQLQESLEGDAQDEERIEQQKVKTTKGKK